MRLVEKHTIKKGNKYYKILDAESYKSKTYIMQHCML